MQQYVHLLIKRIANLISPQLLSHLRQKFFLGLYAGFFAIWLSCSGASTPANNSTGPCAENPCLNGGTCQELSADAAPTTGTTPAEAATYLCVCADGFVGTNCETNLCQDVVCAHGVCKAKENLKTNEMQAYCACDEGYTGKLCEIACGDNQTCGHAGAKCGTNTDCDATLDYYCLPMALSGGLTSGANNEVTSGISSECSLPVAIAQLCNHGDDCRSGVCTVNDDVSTGEQAGVCDCDSEHYGQKCRYPLQTCALKGALSKPTQVNYGAYCACAAAEFGFACEITTDETTKLAIVDAAVSNDSLFTYQDAYYSDLGFSIDFTALKEKLLALPSGSLTTGMLNNGSLSFALFKGSDSEVAKASCLAVNTGSELFKNYADVVDDKYTYLFQTADSNQGMYYLRLQDAEHTFSDCFKLPKPILYVDKTCPVTTGLISEVTFNESKFTANFAEVAGVCAPGYQVKASDPPLAKCLPTGVFGETHGSCEPQDCGLAVRPELPLNAHYLEESTVYLDRAINAACNSGYAASPSEPLTGSIKCEVAGSGVVWGDGRVVGLCLGENNTVCNLNSDCLGVCIQGICHDKAPLAGACDDDADCLDSGVSCSDGVCGGLNALCLENSACAATLGLSCIPNALDNLQHCLPKNPLGSACSDSTDCLVGTCNINDGVSYGVCGGVGAVCLGNDLNLANGRCFTSETLPTTCVLGICTPSSLKGENCDDDHDCLAGLAGEVISCSRNNGELGSCGGLQASCANHNSACINDLVCISDHCSLKATLQGPNNVCDEDADCQDSYCYAANQVYFASGQSLGHCGVNGARCTQPSECVHVCIPAGDSGNPTLRVCADASIGNRCDADSQCDLVAGVHCGGGICGGDGASCAANGACDTSGEVKYTCVPEGSGEAVVHVCRDKARNNGEGSCDNSDGDADCQAGYKCIPDGVLGHKCFLVSDGVDNLCDNLDRDVNGKDSDCFTGKVCVPESLASSRYVCRHVVYGGLCEEHGDCGLTSEQHLLYCSKNNTGEKGTCGGEGAPCGGEQVSMASADQQCDGTATPPYTCIAHVCSVFANNSNLACDSDHDCSVITGRQCSHNDGIVGQCGANGLSCPTNAACQNTCIKGVCQAKAALNESCDDDQDCVTGIKCATSAANPTCGGDGAVCEPADDVLNNEDCVHVCIPTSGSNHICQSPELGGACDDDHDCPTLVNCGSDHLCGGMQASCQDDSACYQGKGTLACVPATPGNSGGAHICLTPAMGGACDTSSDCPAGISCGSSGICGGAGASCESNAVCDLTGVSTSGAVKYSCLPLSVGSTAHQCQALASGMPCDNIDTANGLDTDCLASERCLPASATSNSLEYHCSTVTLGTLCAEEPDCAVPQASNNDLILHCSTLTSAPPYGTCGGLLATCGGSGISLSAANNQCNTLVDNSSCIAGKCQVKSAPGGNCDDHADCSTQSQSQCSRTDGTLGICGADGVACTQNTQCAHTCVGTLCQSKSLKGGVCDDDLDCADSQIKCSVASAPATGSCGGAGAACLKGADCVSNYCLATTRLCSNYPPVSLSYTYSPAVYTVGTAITPNYPELAGGSSNIAYTLESTSPPLPAGLSLDRNTGILSGTPTSASLATDYLIDASNETYKVSFKLNITVKALAPVITTQPNSVTANTGATATFTVVASGAGTLTYQWIKDGVAISGATSSSYTTPALTNADHGSSFTVIVKDSYDNQVASDAAILIIGAQIVAAIDSCTAVKTNNPTAANGVYTIDKDGEGGIPAIKVYCDMTTDGGGWTLVAAQYEVDPLYNWNEGIQADYMINSGSFTPSLLDTYSGIARSFVLNTNELPSHTQTAFGKGSNPTYVGYSNFVYSTGDLTSAGFYNKGIRVQNLKTGNYHLIHRYFYGLFGSHNPDGGFYAAPSPTNGSENNTLTYERTDDASFSSYSWSFSPNAGSRTYMGWGMLGDVSGTAENYAWTVWVRGSAAANPNITSISYALNPVVYTAGVAITANAPTYQGAAPLFYAISPSLPLGFTFNKTTGQLSGTPTALSPVTTYTITASNQANSVKTTLTLSVVPSNAATLAPSGLSYTPTGNITYYLGMPISETVTSGSLSSPALVATYTGGTPTLFTATPALPLGLVLDRLTGVINGTPTILTPRTTYTITASNSAGNTTTTISLEVQTPEPPSPFVYQLSPATYYRGFAITPPNTVSYTPNSAGIIWPATMYSISPDLPTGLVFDTQQGTISGTPTALAPLTDHTITAVNYAGEMLGVLKLTISDPPPPEAVSYPVSTGVYFVGVPMPELAPVTSGGPISTYALTPELPAGLNFDGQSGKITGTPTTSAALTTYTLTVSNSMGSASTTLDLSVHLRSPVGGACNNDAACLSSSCTSQIAGEDFSGTCGGLGAACNDNTSCQGTCINHLCTAAKSLAGESCDDDADCSSTAGMKCSHNDGTLGACGLDGLSCTQDAQCLHTCIAGVCSALAVQGAACDGDHDCAVAAGKCSKNDGSLGTCGGDGASCTTNDACDTSGQVKYTCVPEGSGEAVVHVCRDKARNNGEGSCDNSDGDADCQTGYRCIPDGVLGHKCFLVSDGVDNLCDNLDRDTNGKDSDCFTGKVCVPESLVSSRYVCRHVVYGGLCEEHGDCGLTSEQHLLYCSKNNTGEKGTCGGAGAPCGGEQVSMASADQQCDGTATPPYTCIAQVCNIFANNSNLACDSDHDCSAVVGRQCSHNDGTIGQCGVNGLSCPTNAACQNTCIKGVCQAKAALNESCDDDQDCVTGIKCATSAANPTCGGDGAVCEPADDLLVNEDCVHVCIPTSGSNHICQSPELGGGCDDDHDCPALINCGSDHLCGGREAGCQDDSACYQGKGTLACVPATPGNSGGAHICLTPAMGGACDTSSDCPADISCGSSGICGGAGASCESNAVCDLTGVSTSGAVKYSCLPLSVGSTEHQCQALASGTPCDNADKDLANGLDSDCLASERCLPASATSNSLEYHCSTVTLGTLCGEEADCAFPQANNNGLILHCSTLTSAPPYGTCGGLLATCGGSGIALSAANNQCNTSVDNSSCIGGKCQVKSAPGGSCDDNADCSTQSQTQCSHNDGTLGICGADGAACTQNTQCAHTCVGTLCQSKSVKGGVCDDDLDCADSQIKCSVASAPSTGSCGGGGAACIKGADCVSNYCLATTRLCSNYPPVSLSYTYSPAVYTVGTAITPNYPELAGGSSNIAYTLESTSPPLPAGLSLDRNTGILSGTPTSASLATDYLIDASNETYKVSFKLNITVKALAPVITTQPNSVTVNTGGTATFSVIASGAGTLTYQWSKNGTAISGATSSSYTTPALTSADNGSSFTVTVKDGYDNQVTSDAAILIVGTAVVASIDSCTAVKTNNGAAANGVYTIDKDGPGGTPAIKVYCDMTTDGGGWTLVAAQYEVNPLYDWNKGIQADYMINSGSFTPSLLDSYSGIARSFVLNTNELPSHTQTAFGKGSNPTYVGYSNFVYSTGDLTSAGVYNKGIRVQNLKNGNYHLIHRYFYGLFGSHNPDAGFYPSPSPTNGSENNTLTYERTDDGGVSSFSWSFSPNASSRTYMGWGMLGDVSSTAENYAWTVWVRGSVAANPNITSISYALNPVVYTAGVAITANAPTYQGAAPLFYAISPSLPLGLTFNKTTGQLSGTPTVLSPVTTYTITASNQANSVKTTLTLSVVPSDAATLAPSGLSYTPTGNITYYLGMPISDTVTSGSLSSPALVATSTGGTPTLFTATPTLPGGLVLDRLTGVINGTPTILTPRTTYTITASNSAGNTTTTISVEVQTPEPPSPFVYQLSPATYYRGFAITPPNTVSYTPNSAGIIWPATMYSISPDLPAGLVFDMQQGTITGTPTALAPLTDHTITAVNYAGEMLGVLKLTISDPPPPEAVSYPVSTGVYFVGVPMPELAPVTSGGPISTYALSPELPAGLNFDGQSGKITGTPTTSAALTTYTLTVSNSMGSASTTLDLSVHLRSPVGGACNNDAACLSSSCTSQIAGEDFSGTCGGVNAACNDNTSCQGTCINHLCTAAKSLAGESCDDDADCSSTAGMKCSHNDGSVGTCGLDGLTCTQDAQCLHTCIAGVCSALAVQGAACDGDHDCAVAAGKCSKNDGSMGICGGDGASCAAIDNLNNPDNNQACIHVCIPNILNNGSYLCAIPILGGQCDLDNDCPEGISCGSDHVCGGALAVCTSNANCLESSGYTCAPLAIGSTEHHCLLKGSLNPMPCDHDADTSDCLTNEKCIPYSDDLAAGYICSVPTLNSRCVGNLDCGDNSVLALKCNNDPLVSPTSVGTCGGLGAACGGPVNSISLVAANAQCYSTLLTPVSCIADVCQPKALIAGACDDHGDCTPAGVHCSADGLGNLGVCGASGVSCTANSDCQETCINHVCAPLAAAKGTNVSQVCDDDQDCVDHNCYIPAGQTLGSCGAPGASCDPTDDVTPNQDCQQVCIPVDISGGTNQGAHICAVEGRGKHCDDDLDCPTDVHCYNFVCGGLGAPCANNAGCDAAASAVPSPLYCIPDANGTTQSCAPAGATAASCNDDQDCLHHNCTVHDGISSEGVCGGPLASCTDNIECDVGALPDALYCIPTGEPGKQHCQGISSAGGRCNEAADCVEHNCSATNTSDLTGICGGLGAPCAVDGDNSSCISGLVCIPTGLADNSHICATAALGKHCDSSIDCPQTGGLTVECANAGTTGSLCGGAGALCTQNAECFVSSSSGPKYTCAPETLGSTVHKCRDLTVLDAPCDNADQDSDCSNLQKCVPAALLASDPNSAYYQCTTVQPGSICADDLDCNVSLNLYCSASVLAPPYGTCGGYGAKCLNNLQCESNELNHFTCVPTAPFTGSVCMEKSPLGSACNDHNDCLPNEANNPVKCSINQQTLMNGTCGGVNAPCGTGNETKVDANLECTSGNTCVGGSCVLKTATSQICDDDGDCNGALKCSALAGVGVCGGIGSPCTANSNCDTTLTSLSCLPYSGSLSCEVLSSPGGACNDQADCAKVSSTYNVACTMNDGVSLNGVCGGVGAACGVASESLSIANTECAPGDTCISQACALKPQLSEACDDDLDCTSPYKCAISTGALGVCGGAGSNCTNNSDCNSTTSNLSCLPNVPVIQAKVPAFGTGTFICAPRSALGELCNDQGDCASVSSGSSVGCTLSNPNATSGGICGGLNAPCASSGDNLSCLTGLVCTPTSPTAQSGAHVCTNLTTGGYCDKRDLAFDCPTVTVGTGAPLAVYCSSGGICGSTGALCTAGGTSGNAQCLTASSLTCIYPSCSAKSAKGGLCDDDADCTSASNNVKCSANTNTAPVGTIGFCGGHGAACTAAIDCMSGGGCLSNKCSLPPAGLSYTANPVTYYQGVAVTPNSAVLANGSSVTYTAVPSLPSGLILDPNFGTITGTPTVITGPPVVTTGTTPGTGYLISATNSAGTASVRLNIAVKGLNELMPTQPSDEAVLLGNPVTFVAGGYSTGSYSYQWMKNDVDIPGATSTVYAPTNSASMGDIFDTYKMKLTFSDPKSSPNPITVVSNPAWIKVSRWDGIKEVGLGITHTCVLTFSGKVKCFGNNGSGYLGYGDTTSRGNNMSEMQFNLPYLTFPNRGNNSYIKSLRVVKRHTCTVFSDGTATCWGDNSFYQLGFADSTNRTTPSNLMTNSTGLWIKDAHLGSFVDSYNTCILFTNGYARCFGYNAYNECGLATTNNVSGGQALPNNVSSNIIFGTDGVNNQSSFKKFVGASYLICGLSTSGYVKCWGSGPGSLLPSGTTIPISNMAALNFGANTISDISGVNVIYQLCGLLNSQQLKCAGSYNSYGALGYEDTNDHFADGTLPIVNVGTGRLVKSISSSSDYSFCAILEDNSLKCWGYNTHGELGLGDTTNRGDSTAGGHRMGDLLPTVPLGPLAQVKAQPYFGSSTGHKCVVLNNNHLKCWGGSGADTNALGLGLGANPHGTDDTNALYRMGEDLPVVPVLSPHDGLSYKFNPAIYKTGTAVVVNSATVPTTRSLAYTVSPALPAGLTLNSSNGTISGTPTAATTTTEYLITANASTGAGNAKDYGSVSTLLVLTVQDSLYPLISMSPKNQTSFVGGTAVFKVYAVSTGALSYQWQVQAQGSTDYVNISGATSASYTTPVLALSNHGDAYRVVISDGTATTTSTVATLSVLNNDSANQVTMGSNYTCVLSASKKVKCFGDNSSGQLGYGDSTNRTSPGVAVVSSGGSPISANKIVAGFCHTCALLSDQSVSCFGCNASGQLGINSTGAINAPTGGVNLNGEQVQDIAVGGSDATCNHTCVVLAKGEVRCFGCNSSGQLGYGDTTNRANTTTVNYRAQDLASINLGTDEVGNNLVAQKVVAGQNFTCVLFNNQRVKCFGANASGQLGYGDTTTRGNTVASMGDNLPFVKFGAYRDGVLQVPWMVMDIAAGNTHVCALLTNRLNGYQMLKCFGGNASGQLGYGDTVTRGNAVTPIDTNPVAGSMGDYLPLVDLGYLRTVKAVTTYGDSVCSLLDTNRLKCFGLNTSGQLGYGDTTNRSTTMGKVMRDYLPNLNLGTGSISLNKLSMSSPAVAKHNCVIYTDGNLKCFGYNASGQLGYGDTTTRGNGGAVTDVNLPNVNLGLPW